MLIKTLTLANYRNYKKETITFSPHINILLGENAQGKTNLIEAIHVLALTKSHRTNHERELIYLTEEFTKLVVTLEKNAGNESLSLIIHKNGKKAHIGQVEQKKLSQYIGQLKVVLFAPEDLNVIKGAPSYRRRFIDMELGQMSAPYLFHLASYQKILKQRNLYLKQQNKDLLYLDVLTEQLIQLAAHVLYQRIHFVQGLEKWASHFHQHISNQKEILTLQYVSQVDWLLSDTYEDLVEKLKQLFEKYKKRELEQGMTLVGPHRDDLLFFVNEQNVQIYGSQGQQRTCALSLKLAEIDLIHETTGEYPVLLLDDVLSELDDTRQTYLLKAIENKVQTFITTTNLDGIQKNEIKDPKIFIITNGKVE